MSSTGPNWITAPAFWVGRSGAEPAPEEALSYCGPEQGRKEPQSCQRQLSAEVGYGNCFIGSVWPTFRFQNIVSPRSQ